MRFLGLSLILFAFGSSRKFDQSDHECSPIIQCPRGRFVGRDGERGGGAIVGTGAQASVDVLVDVKLSKPVVRKSFVDRHDFKVELNALRCLKNIPNVIEMICVASSTKSMILEYGEEGDLTSPKLFNDYSFKALPRSVQYDMVVFMTAQMVASVIGVHRRGFLHGDIKPENFVRSKGFRVKLVDFGLSRRLGGWEIIDQGTPVTMAPEIAFETDYNADLVDESMLPYQMVQESMDWWSVGVAIHYLFAKFFHSTTTTTNNNSNQPRSKDSHYFPYKVVWSANHDRIIRFDYYPIRPEFPSDLVDFLKRLIIEDGAECRNYRGKGVRELLEHPLFSKIDWNSVDSELNNVM